MGNLNYNFSGHTVVVSGGTRGIGAAISNAFLLSGAKVIAIFAGNKTAAESFAKEHNGMPLFIEQLDVSDYSAVERFFAEYSAKHSSLDILVNCAGIRLDSVVAMMKPNQWQRVIDVNLNGTFNMSKFAVLKMMEKRFGRIINIVSPSGKYGFAGQANYAATKAAQEAFSRSLSKETAKKNITVNCVSPGFIDTDFIADLSEEQRAQYRERIPLRRFGRPEEVANLVLFLASEEASYITGATFELSGGL